MEPKLYWIRELPSGRLAISARPRGGDWLEGEVAGWRKQGVDVVVSLLTDSENQELDLLREASVAGQKGLNFYSFPIEDRGVPSSSSRIEQLVSQLISEIHGGKSIAIHCRQGIGRSALLSAAVLISAGQDLDQSLKAIREARGMEVPETSEQYGWLKRFANTHAPDFARQNR